MNVEDERIVDEGLYAEMCQPHPDLASAKAAERAFAAGVRRLRKKHRISNLLLASLVFYSGEDGNTKADVMQSTCGSDLIMPRLARGLHEEWEPRGRDALVQAFVADARQRAKR